MYENISISFTPWKPQDLLDDLQAVIDEEPDIYPNWRRVTLCEARDYLKEFFQSCEGCIWAERKRPQKCSCCRRNLYMKDCYEWEGESNE